MHQNNQSSSKNDQLEQSDDYYQYNSPESKGSGDSR